MTSERTEPSLSSRHLPRRVGLGALLAVIALFVGLDSAIDLVQGTDLIHVSFHLIGLAVVVPAAIWVWRSGAQELNQLRRDLTKTREEAVRWRAEARDAVEGLSVAIDRQFDRWELTPAEREVCLLLLKGLSLREIAAVRDTGERTAREQARAIYRKSALAGRAELAAFFLEDLLAPRDG
jgi:DNA-binding CsgD family transcriptional regulator